MSSAVGALPSAAKSPKKSSRFQGMSQRDILITMIINAASQNKSRRGVSLVGLKQSLKTGGYDVAKNNTRVLTAVKRLVADKTLIQTKGTGASGSFRLNKKPPAPQKKKMMTPKAKRVKKAKTAAAGGATPAAKTSTRRKRKTKSPKAKSPKAKSPKKTRVVKSRRTRSSAKK